MHQCPFCKGQVADEIARFGGHCPHCLNEVPGEETSTDPGEALRQQEEAALRLAEGRARRRANAIRAIAAGLALGTGSAWFASRETVKPLVLTEGEFYIVPASAHQDPNYRPPESEQKAAEAAAQTRRASRRSTGGSSATAAPVSTSGGAGPTDAAPEATGTGERAASALPISLPPLPSRGPALKDLGGFALTRDDEIRNMVKERLALGSKQLRQCYEARLKEDPDLEGRWVVSFVIQKDGTARDARARGEGVRDQMFEQCIVSNVERWKFQPLQEPVEIQTPPFVFTN